MARPARQDYVPLMIEAAKRRLLAGDEVRLTEIADELQVSGPLVHYYFKDRQELVDAAWREILYAFVATDEKEMVGYAGSADWDGVRGLIERVFAPHRDHIHAAHLRAVVEALGSDELAATVSEVHRETIARWQTLLESSIASGAAATPLDTRAVSMLVVGVSLGIAAIDRDLGPHDRRRVAEAWATMLRAVLDPSYRVPFPADGPVGGDTDQSPADEPVGGDTDQSPADRSSA